LAARQKLKTEYQSRHWNTNHWGEEIFRSTKKIWKVHLRPESLERGVPNPA